MADKITMGINWEDPKFKQMEEVFLGLGKQALAMNHYDLADVTEFDNPQDWKDFLQNEYVNKYITDEFNSIQDSELRKLVLNISDSSSVGKAQIINALQKVLNDTDDNKKSGPAFIYTYVPLTPEEKNADNVEVLDHDPFIKTVPTGRCQETTEN